MGKNGSYSIFLYLILNECDIDSPAMPLLGNFLLSLDFVVIFQNTQILLSQSNTRSGANLETVNAMM